MRGRLGWLVRCERVSSLTVWNAVVVYEGESASSCEKLASVWCGVLLYKVLERERERNVHCDEGVSMCGRAQQCCAREKEKTALWTDKFVTSLSRCWSFFLRYFFAVGFIVFLSVNLNRGPYLIFFFFFQCVGLFCGSSCFINERCFVAFLAIVAAERGVMHSNALGVHDIFRLIYLAFNVVKSKCFSDGCLCCLDATLKIAVNKASGNACHQLKSIVRIHRHCQWSL